MSVIRVENMTKDFGHGRGIFNVDFQVGKGEVLGFLGPNGAGKTTTIRHLLGFTQPSKGTAEIMGLDCLGQHSQVMQYVGYLPGEIALPEGLTGWQFIRMMQQMRQIESDDYLHYLLDLFEFDPSGSTKRMSLGDKRKLAVVTAFMGNPDILILDEPTSGLDPLMQEKFIQFMVEEKRRGKTILLSSHIFPEVEATCDRIIIIKEGKLVAEVNAKELKNEDEKQLGINALMDSGFTVQSILALNLGAFGVTFALAGIVFAASGIFNLSKTVMSTGGLAVIAFIILAIVGSFADYGVSDLEIVQKLTILSLYNIDDILVEGTKWLPQLAILGAIGVTGFAVGSTVFTRKDLPL